MKDEWAFNGAATGLTFRKQMLALKILTCLDQKGVLDAILRIILAIISKEITQIQMQDGLLDREIITKETALARFLFFVAFLGKFDKMRI